MPRNGLTLEVEIDHEDAKTIKRWLGEGIEVDTRGLQTVLWIFSCFSHADVLRRLSMLTTLRRRISEEIVCQALFPGGKQC